MASRSTRRDQTCGESRTDVEAGSHIAERGYLRRDGPVCRAHRATWDERAPAHAASPDYRVKRFEEDPEFISDVIRFDLPRLGDIRGRRGLHLQCHIGTDTISLARLGAHVTGLDLSPASLRHARLLSQRAGPEVEFVEAELYDAVAVLGAEAFDFVFTGIGALCWLPSIRRWANIVAELLVSGGRLFMREAHPMLWTLDDERSDDLLVAEYPYFELEEPLIFDTPGTYVKTESTFTHNRTHEWNHGLGEIVTALLDAGMELTMLVEHDSVPWEGLPGRMTQIELGEWRLTDRPSRLPHTYTLQAIKRG
jgi:SAM-dependent methyltransferase